MVRALVIVVVLAGCKGGRDAPKDAALAPCRAEVERSGEATYYDADGTGKCSFAASPDVGVAAINRADFAGATACGACAEVEGPAGTVTVRIVDSCPGCDPGDLDLGRAAFEQIASLDAGRVPITWRFVACEVDGPIRYHFKDGSSPGWTALQVRNHRHAIATLEARVGGAYQPLTREPYNYFVAPSGLGAAPLALRVTDVHGIVAEEPAIPPGDDVELPGLTQLAPCR